MNVYLRVACPALLLLFLTSCSTPPAPVEERSTGSMRDVSELTDGMYRVSRGETLYSIAFKYGLDWKDVARWNSIRSPYTIYPGQEVRLTAPPVTRRTSSAAIATRAAARTPTATTRSAEPRSTTTTASSESTSSQPPETAATTSPEPVPAPAQSTQVAAATQSDPVPGGPLQDPTSWLWPTDGRVVSTFSSGDPSRKGIDIRGTEGQDVVASATGDVVYSGNGLIGFGELIIVKHSDRMLTAYAHNRERLVQEGQRVAAGQKIAEMGRNDQEEVMLHFELRVVGKPVDPLRYLPPQ